jgi:hypothetical protein
MEGTMSDLDELEKKLQENIDKCDDTLNGISELNKIAPHIQKYKEDKTTSLRIIKHLPKDIAEEIAPKLLAWENEEDEVISPYFPVIQKTNPSLFIQAVNTSTGSATPYIVNATNSILQTPFEADNPPEWIGNELSIIDDYTQKVQQKGYIPTRLNKIGQCLGDKYQIADESYIKAINGIISVDQAAIHLRDVLQQTWGSLANLARQKNKDQKINLNNLEFKNDHDRLKVADILANNYLPKQRLLDLLSKAYSLFKNLSDSNFGKNILGTDTKTLEIYHDQWIAFLDSISGLGSSNI